MITQKIGDNTVCFFAPTQKELTLSFFRVQEYYESQKPELFRQKFTVADFLDSMMNKKGEIDYFADWDGFNVPGFIFSEWLESIAGDKPTKYEQKMINQVNSVIDKKRKYYVIGVLQNDIPTLKHELSHSFYYLDVNYKSEADNIVYTFKANSPKLYNKIFKKLKKLGYNDSVLYDEMVAWLATSSRKELEKIFEVDYHSIQPFVKLFRKLLRKYNRYC